jgi:deoxyinosine 3'endonuclease (endonuclease V)
MTGILRGPRRAGLAVIGLVLAAPGVGVAHPPDPCTAERSELRGGWCRVRPRLPGR